MGSLRIYRTTGQFLTQFGTAGSASSRFSNPQGVAVDPISRNVIVADWRQCAGGGF